MAISELKFSKDWNNGEDFPAVANDAAQARANIQYLHDETKNYINEELVPAVQAAGDILKHCWRVRDFDPVTGESGEWRHVYSEERNAYPDSGIKNEREYEYLGVPVDFATPPGGKAGQVLAKATDADHDYHWADLAQEVIVVPGEGGEGESGEVVVNISGAVRYNISQALTSTQKALARQNIGAASQSLSIQVENLSGDVAGVKSEVADVTGKVTTLTQTVEEIKASAGNGEGDTSELAVRVDGISAKVTDAEEEIGQLQLKSDEFSTKISEVEDDAEENAAKYTELKQTVDDISFTVSDPIDGGTNRYVTMTLTVGGNEHTGVVMIDGNVDVSGQLSAEALYATLGDIARLKVDSLSTSRRIPMYLAKDTSDDNYIDIQEQHITLRRAWTDGSTEQAKDDFGALIYWEQDISNATLGSDGYPYVDGARVFITTEETDWPVTVYKYQSGDRLKLFFDENNNFGPKMIWGEGDGTSSGKGRGYIEKLGMSFDIYNLGSDGQKRGVFMGNEYLDIYGERQPTKMAWSGNTLTVTYQGGITKTFTFSDDLTTLTYDGHTVELEGFA